MGWDVIGLLLPLWLNLESAGPAPTHHDAPEERYLAVAAECRTFAVDGEVRTLDVPPEKRELSC